MPSVSKKQHNLMAAVANNPAFAKKVGISQSVGKEFMKADKRKGKKYALGGPTKYAADDSDEGMQMSTRRMPSSKKESGMSDEERYGKVGAAIRRLDPEAFKNRTDRSAAGNLKLLRELQEKSKPAAAASPKVEIEKTETKIEAPVRGRGGAGERPSKTIAEQLDERPGSGAGFRRLMTRFGTAEQRARGRAMGYGEDEGDSEESPAMRRARIAREVAEGSRGPGSRYTPIQGMSMAERRMYEAGRMRHGGKVKKYKSGGSVSSASKRADGIATKGKTRGKFV